LFPTSGVVETNGRIAALLELGSGFNPEFTGRENVYLNGAVLGLTKEEIDMRFCDIAAFADIGDFIEQPVKTYSSGMFVRLAFAIQANVDPDILIVDEALAVGDASFIHKCMLRFHDLQERGATILMVSHDATAIKTLCNRAIWLEHSCVAADGLSGQVVDQYLSAVSKQIVLMNYGQSRESTNTAHTDGQNSGETGIPNMDRRMGDQSCFFVGVGLYDHKMLRSNILPNNSKVVLRVTFKNNSVDEGAILVLGYCLRNSRGIDIASNNSEIENIVIKPPQQGTVQTVRVYIDVPELHPGSYSLNVSIGSRDDKGRMHSLDGITNALVFDVVAKRPVHVLMSLKTEYEVELQNE
jgi:lipopolysaccharide transport system ATP-binding protein